LTFASVSSEVWPRSARRRSKFYEVSKVFEFGLILVSCSLTSYTTPKKIKHKRKPVKMAVLKYYRVDSDGKIKRLRRECPSESCGAACFMANHKDRQYCGKCGLTYKLDGDNKA
jgi:ribosomal protein S27AE